MIQKTVFDKMSLLFYSKDMFVSVVLDPGRAESARELAELLTLHGFKKVQRSCWESASISEERLMSLKKDIDSVTDYYDSIRMYQYPVEEFLAITELTRKKWRKVLVRMPKQEAPEVKKVTVHKKVIRK